jgi:glutathione peroxidase
MNSGFSLRSREDQLRFKIMLSRIVIPSIVMACSSFAADLPSIPFKDIQGKETSLEDYKGKVVMIVNVASKCGNTPQYKPLEAMYQKYKGQGLVILGFPCNDFNGQEPGTAKEIQEFCKATYAVTFPLMEKVHVKGEGQHPLFAALTGSQGAFPGDVKWNFGKFLIGRDGKPIARFEPKTLPDSPEVVAEVEKALEVKP